MRPTTTDLILRLLVLAAALALFFAAVYLAGTF